MRTAFRKPPLAILGGADPGSDAFERAAGGQVPSVIPEGSMPPADWPATVVVPCGMGDARNLIMALAGDACIVSGGRACTISEVWLHKRPLLPLAGAGGRSDALPDTPPDERGNSPILPWRNSNELAGRLRVLGMLQH
ncbi:SLOG cluster 4 domain-containing protein [Stenotrophomonas muris]|uniref:SLOG cluster 4 domain-containing protein n=1 Tax=Stenotrophomonas muris TaxID=2963283 RepID=UPI0040559C24